MKTFRTSRNLGRLALSDTSCAGCGPESMKTDLHNTAAAAQSRVLGGGADTVWLYMEGFGW